MIACTKCGSRADATDSVCPQCGGFLAGSRDVEMLTVGGVSDDSEQTIVSEETRLLEAGEAAGSRTQNIWPTVSRVAVLIFYLVFVIAVAVAVNWALRRL